MSQISEIPTIIAKKKAKIPNAYMLFVKERKMDLVRQCPEQNKEIIGTYLGKMWKSLGAEEKQVYIDKYNALKKADQGKLEELEFLESTDEVSPLGSRNECTPVPEITTINPLPLKIKHKDLKQKKNLTMDMSGVILDEEHIDTKEGDRGPLLCSGMDDLIAKQNSKSKKARRPPNAFLLFASDQRKKLTIPHPIDESNKQRHANKVLGMIWNEMPDGDKEKYFLEARRLSKIHKDCPGLCNKSSYKASQRKSSKSYLKKKGNKKKLKQMPAMPKVLRSSSQPSVSILKTDNAHANLTEPQKQETADNTEIINMKNQPTTKHYQKSASVSYTGFQQKDALVSSLYSFDSATNSSVATYPTTSSFAVAPATYPTTSSFAVAPATYPTTSSFPVAPATYPTTSSFPVAPATYPTTSSSIPAASVAYPVSSNSYSFPTFSSSLQPPCRCQYSPRQWSPNRELIPHQSIFGTGMDLPYFGSGFHQSLLPYQMADSTFWMYRQSFLQRPYNFMGHPYSNSYCHCSTPYPQFPSPYVNPCAAERRDMYNPIIEPSPPITKPTSSVVAAGVVKEDNEDDCSNSSHTLIIDEDDEPN